MPSSAGPRSPRTSPARTAPAFILDIIVGAVAFSCLGFAVASFITNIDAAQPAVLAIVLPLCFLSGVFIPILEPPRWLIDVGKIFPVHALADVLRAAYNPHTAGPGLRWGDLAVLAAWVCRLHHRHAPLQLASARRMSLARSTHDRTFARKGKDAFGRSSQLPPAPRFCAPGSSPGRSELHPRGA